MCILTSIPETFSSVSFPTFWYCCGATSLILLLEETICQSICFFTCQGVLMCMSSILFLQSFCNQKSLPHSRANFSGYVQSTSCCVCFPGLADLCWCHLQKCYKSQHYCQQLYQPPISLAAYWENLQPPQIPLESRSDLTNKWIKKTTRAWRWSPALIYWHFTRLLDVSRDFIRAPYFFGFSWPCVCHTPLLMRSRMMHDIRS